jgi:hypothetical protein
MMETSYFLWSFVSTCQECLNSARAQRRSGIPPVVTGNRLDSGLLPVLILFFSRLEGMDTEAFSMAGAGCRKATRAPVAVPLFR